MLHAYFSRAFSWTGQARMFASTISVLSKRRRISGLSRKARRMSWYQLLRSSMALLNAARWVGKTLAGVYVSIVSMILGMRTSGSSST